MAFTPEFLDELRGRVPLAGAIGRRVQLKKRGREFVGLCPFHNEKTPSFTVNEEKGFFHCFGCGAHGDVIGLVMRVDNLSFPEVVERLAGQAGLEIPVSTPEERGQAEQRKSLYAVTEAACSWFEHRLRQPAGREGFDYLKGRGLDDTVIARFRLGFAPDARAALKAALARQDFAEEQMIAAGLVIRPEDGRESYDRFRGRVIFPIADRRGRVIAFGGRLLGDGQPKYLNSPDTPLFSKGRVLYGLAQALEAARESGEIIVTEGYMDVIALHRAGFKNAVAPLGTAITEMQIEMLWRVVPEPVLCFDGDQAGRRAATRAAERVLPLLKPGHSLRFYLLPEGEDPGSRIEGQTRAGMHDVVYLKTESRPLSEMLWEMETQGRPIDTPERRAALERRLEDLVLRIADRRVQAHYRSHFRSKLWQLLRGSGQAKPRPPRRDVGLRSDVDVGSLPLRVEQGFLAAIINHPALLKHVGEELAGLQLAEGELDKLRAEIIKTSGSDLDSATLRSHLRERGCSDVLDRLLTQDVYEAAPFSRPDKTVEEVLREWNSVWTRYWRRQDRAELEEDTKALGKDMTPERWARISARKHEMQMAESLDADQDDLESERMSGD